MNALILVVLFAGSSAFADVALYCGGLSVEGSFLKVIPAQKEMCISAGPWGENYCASATTVFKISETRVGSLNIGGKVFSFREFIGQSGSNTQLVRVFDETSNPSAAEITVHRADLAGPITQINLGLPTAEAKDGDPTCLIGDDSSF